MTEIWHDNAPADVFDPPWRRRVRLTLLGFALLSVALPIVSDGLILSWPIAIALTALFVSLALFVPILIESMMPRAVTFAEHEIIWRNRRGTIRRRAYDEIVGVYPSR